MHGARQDRLVSAYERHIAAQTKETNVHRAWIRELHTLGDKDHITFSHFVRWVAQQDGARWMCTRKPPRAPFCRACEAHPAL